MTTKINYKYIIKKTMEMLKTPVATFATIVVLTVFTHWTLVQVYARYCAPSGWTGPFQTFLTLGSPMCHFTNMIQVELAKHYITIWIAAAAATATRIASNVITYGTPNQIDT